MLIQHLHLGNSFHKLTKRDTIQSMYWIRHEWKQTKTICWWSLTRWTNDYCTSSMKLSLLTDHSSLLFSHWATYTSINNAGTSISGPIVADKASSECIPNTATDIAIANSKLLDEAVNDWVTVWPRHEKNTANQKYSNIGRPLDRHRQSHWSLDFPETWRLLWLYTQNLSVPHDQILVEISLEAISAVNLTEYLVKIPATYGQPRKWMTHQRNEE